jgi:hypothetical protein
VYLVGPSLLALVVSTGGVLDRCQDCLLAWRVAVVGQIGHTAQLACRDIAGVPLQLRGCSFEARSDGIENPCRPLASKNSTPRFSSAR